MRRWLGVVLALALAGMCGLGSAEDAMDFELNLSYETESEGTVHYNLYVPEGYDGSEPYALHIALPGWEGLYFQGVGADLRWEYLPYESRNYAADMIVASVQLDGWNRDSARQVVAFMEYMLTEYNIDPGRVFISGYSAGGEALSLVMEIKPELYAAALFVSSQWDGDSQPLVNAQTPLYIFTSEHDAWYGSEPARTAWQRIHDLYAEAGLSEDAIDGILALDIRPDAWFDAVMAADTERTGNMYATDYHGAGMLVAFDDTAMKWVFDR